MPWRLTSYRGQVIDPTVVFGYLLDILVGISNKTIVICVQLSVAWTLLFFLDDLNFVLLLDDAHGYGRFSHLNLVFQSNLIVFNLLSWWSLNFLLLKLHLPITVFFSFPGIRPFVDGVVCTFVAILLFKTLLPLLLDYRFSFALFFDALQGFTSTLIGRSPYFLKSLSNRAFAGLQERGSLDKVDS